MTLMQAGQSPPESARAAALLCGPPRNYGFAFQTLRFTVTPSESVSSAGDLLPRA